MVAQASGSEDHHPSGDVMWRDALDALSVRRVANDQDRSEIMSEYAAIAERMFREGYSKVRIARMAQLNRKTVIAMTEGM